MTDHELEQRLRSWYQAEIPADEAAPAALRSRSVAIPKAVPVPLRERARGRGLTLLAAAAILTTAIVGGALLGGSTLFAPPSDAPSTAPSADGQATAFPAAGQIVYTRRVRLADGEGDCVTRFVFCHRSSVVIADADGANERELVPGPSSALLAASADGSKLLASMPEGARVVWYLTDASGSAPQRLEIPCEAPCDADWAFAFSPDGSRLAFMRTRTDGSVIAIMDMVTRTVVELESTKGYAAPPGWSPDGSRLAFGNHVVDADGSNFQQVAPGTLFTGMDGQFDGGLAAPQWSTDSSLIVFTSFNDTLTTDPPDNSQRLMDIYVVRADGTGLQRLTRDTAPPLGSTDAGELGASFPTWTSGGRIVFTRFVLASVFQAELWVMDADGRNATRLDPSDAAVLTALGCLACTYPALTDYDVPNFAYWIPGR